jgi:hypothetical protein
VSLADLIRGNRESGAVATVTVATPATLEGQGGRTVAKVASVAVANHGSEKTACPVLDPGASRRWLVSTPDGEALDLIYCPPATREQVLGWHPGALSVEPYQPQARTPAAPLSNAEAARLRAWLEGWEDDPATRAEIWDKCQGDADARAYWLGRAGEVPGPDTLDDRRTCRECVNPAKSGRCLAAGRGDLVATARDYRPPPDRLHRCEGYAPGAEVPDRRPGRERWPGLTKPRAD